MLSLNDLSQAFDAYKSGSVSLDKFVDWYLYASLRKFDASADVLDACLAIDATLARLVDREIEESEFLREIADAVRHPDIEVVVVTSGLKPDQWVDVAIRTSPVRHRHRKQQDIEEYTESLRRPSTAYALGSLRQCARA